jgi:hypothetical protein
MKRLAGANNLVEAVKNASFVKLKEGMKVQADEPSSYIVTFKVNYDLSSTDNGELVDAISSCGKELQTACKNQLIEQVKKDPESWQAHAMALDNYDADQDINQYKDQAIKELVNYLNSPEFAEIIEEQDAEILDANTFQIMYL